MFLRARPVVVAIFIVTAAAHAQDVAEGPRSVSGGRRFEVASVRPSPESQRMSTSGSRNPGRFQVTGYPLVQLLARAYEVEVARIVAPEWTVRARFDIEATMPPDTTPPQRLEMLRGLLEDRFSVKARREVRSMSVLALQRIRDDDRLGPQLKQVQRDCTQVSREAPSPCASIETPGRWSARGATWDSINLAGFLETYLRTIVVDRTELSGQFDFTLEWQEGLAGAPDQSHLPASVQGALREQLGLRLERVREDIEMLVIDQVSMPSQN
jgi:uncharacterized protein (TIGR03435 family)